GKNCIVNTRFVPAGDFALLARAYKTPVAQKQEKIYTALKLGNAWKLRNCTENLLTMDHCRCEVEGKELFAKEYVLTINDALLAIEKENLPVALEFTFQADANFDASKPLTLLVERPERMKISVNGTAVSNKPNGFFADPAFERIDITGTVRQGKNTIRLETNYHQFQQTFDCLRAAKIFESERNKLSLDSEIEAIYLAGDFGVKTPGEFTQLSDDSSRYSGEFILTSRPAEVAGDHLEESGLPFFAGEATIAQTLTLTKEEAASPKELRIDMFYGNVLICKINGTEIGTLTRPDYCLQIPEGLLKAGDNDLELTIVTSLRNMLGPHHLEEGDSHAVSPTSFYKTPNGPFTSHGAFPWNDGYCFVRHGIR
ncbi:MAG: hypothetical protein MJ106_08115, partial [Lentisphaeria bacterium]|nr:hypothetical protein [Lentisphaeria bacterium]